MAEVAVAGHHQFEIADGSWARLALNFKRIRVLPPVGKARRYPPLTLTVIHAKEVDPPCCILGWPVFWMTMLNRVPRDEPAELALVPAESLLERGARELREEIRRDPAYAAIEPCT